MDLEGLILIGLFLLAVPLLGTVLAMVLGVVITLSRRRATPRAGHSTFLVLDGLEERLRIAAAFLGCSVEGARSVPDRRAEERRMRGRRRQTRAQTDRRRHDRRSWDRRRLRNRTGRH